MERPKRRQQGDLPCGWNAPASLAAEARRAGPAVPVLVATVPEYPGMQVGPHGTSVIPAWRSGTKTMRKTIQASLTVAAAVLAASLFTAVARAEGENEPFLFRSARRRLFRRLGRHRFGGLSQPCGPACRAAGPGRRDAAPGWRRGCGPDRLAAHGVLRRNRGHEAGPGRPRYFARRSVTALPRGRQSRLMVARPQPEPGSL